MQTQPIHHDHIVTTTTTAVTTNATSPSTVAFCPIPIPSPIIFLFLTLIVTTSATTLLCAAIMSDHWEHISWDRTMVDRLTINSTKMLVHWHLNDQVAGIDVKFNDKMETLYLVPMNGGIWTLCIDLTEQNMRSLGKYRFPHTEKCINYLADSIYTNNRGEELWRNTGFPSYYHPQLRMQNLSISCSLVCLIILSCSALLGTFGICQKQISAVLITGVMYLLAALFALFTLMITHVKRQQVKPIDPEFEGTIEGLVTIKSVAKFVHPLLVARIFTTSWCLDLAWGGVALCSITSIMWIILSKIMRYNSFSSVI